MSPEAGADAIENQLYGRVRAMDLRFRYPSQELT
jgi:hypothetical protein